MVEIGSRVVTRAGEFASDGYGQDSWCGKVVKGPNAKGRWRVEWSSPQESIDWHPEKKVREWVDRAASGASCAKPSAVQSDADFLADIAENESEDERPPPPKPKLKPSARSAAPQRGLAARAARLK